MEYDGITVLLILWDAPHLKPYKGQGIHGKDVSLTQLRLIDLARNDAVHSMTYVHLLGWFSTPIECIIVYGYTHIYFDDVVL